MVDLKTPKMKAKDVVNIESQITLMPKPVTGDKCYPKSHIFLLLAILLTGGLSIFLILASNTYIFRYESFTTDDESFTTESPAVIPSPVLDIPFEYTLVFKYSNSTRLICNLHRSDEEVVGCPAFSITHWVDLWGRNVIFCCLIQETGKVFRIPETPLIDKDVLTKGNLSELWIPQKKQKQTNQMDKETEETIPFRWILLLGPHQQYFEIENRDEDDSATVWILKHTDGKRRLA